MTDTNGVLILIRHGQSEWNKKGLWTGLTDIPLSDEGFDEARKAAETIKGIRIDEVFTSALSRAQQTLDEVMKVLHLTLEVTKTPALNERDYGDYTGKNKWEVEQEVGEERFQTIRRSWDYPIPNGESLKDVYTRVVPYYEEHILPELKKGKHILVSAHGNSLRALIKDIEHISDIDIPHLELHTGDVYIYEIDQQGNMVSKKVAKVAGGRE